MPIPGLLAVVRTVLAKQFVWWSASRNAVCAPLYATLRAGQHHHLSEEPAGALTRRGKPPQARPGVPLDMGRRQPAAAPRNTPALFRARAHRGEAPGVHRGYEQRARLHAARQEVGRLCTHPLPQLRVRLPPPRPLLRPRNRWPSPPRSGTRRGPALGEPGHRVAQHEVCHKASSSAGRNTARPHGARPPSFATPMLPWPRLPLPGPESRRL